VQKAFLWIIGLVFFTSLACEYSASTANITGATLAKDAEGSSPTTLFDSEDVFYVVVDLANAPDNTTVKTTWLLVEAEGLDTESVLEETELTTGSGQLHFELSNSERWPVGDYKVDLYLNGSLDRSLAFEVQGPVVVMEPEPTRGPTPTSTSEPTANVTPTAAGRSQGDMLPTAFPTVEGDGQALSLTLEPYVHPSQAFSFAVPESWELYSEDELSVAFGDDETRFGVIFLNTGVTFDQEQAIEFVTRTVSLVADSFADNYEIIDEDNLLEDSGLYYVALSFDDGNGLADFFYEQHEQVIYVFYFASLQYDDLQTTRDAILDTYQIDVGAARAAVPTPTPVLPAATPTVGSPVTNIGQPPPGMARVYLQNEFSNEYNIDFGDGAGSIKVLPGTQDFYHDITPGKYQPGLSLPGGGATNIELEIGPDQAWVIVLTSNLHIRWGQVYP
jgi:hypothetical protein